MLVTNVLSQIINYHWFGLIMKQVYRNISKALGYELKDGDIDLQRQNDEGTSDKKSKVKDSKKDN